MKIGYPCINHSVGCQGDRTFRLRSYSEQRLTDTVARNLACLERILEYNVEHGLLFFRITSELVPFASHPVCRFDWQAHFATQFKKLGQYINRHQIRISMHPDQFIVLNSPKEIVVKRSVAELRYHAEVLDLMGLDRTARIQLHVGGVYGDPEKAMARFARNHEKLDPAIKRRLVIENDDRRYDLASVLEVSAATGAPVLFDHLHHQVLSSGEPLDEALEACAATWGPADGLPMVDYSQQEPGGVAGKHARTLDPGAFGRFLEASAGFDLDIMLEIKDKEKSAARAVEVAGSDGRLVASV